MTEASDRATQMLVAANRILSHEEIIDAYGHVSVRDPERTDRFLLARGRSPELVEVADVQVYEADGSPVAPGPAGYLERFIHAAIYAVRPDVCAIVHAHTEAVLPFTISATPLEAVVESAAAIGGPVPVWDIRGTFGDATNHLVTDLAKADDLTSALGTGEFVLMRGHGFVAAAASLPLVVRNSVYLARNARVQQSAMAMGAYTPLTPGEIAGYRESPISQGDTPPTLRAWEYFARRAGCEDLLR